MFDVFQFEQGVASSGGIPVFVKNIPWISGWVEVRIAIRAGARWDPVGKEGLAHFFEHMPFQGSSQFPTNETVRAIDDEIFVGSLNASTSFDGIVFQGKFQKSSTKEAINFLHDLIFNPLLRAADIEKEAGVIVQEIWADYGRETIVNIIRTFREDVFLRHPFGRMNSTAIGWPDTVMNITSADIANFHKQYFHLGNVVGLLFVGDITFPEAQDLANVFLEAAPQGEISLMPLPVKTPWPPPSCLERDISEAEWAGLKKKTKNTTDILFRRVLPRLANPEILTILGDIVLEIVSDVVRERAGAAYDITEDRNDYWDIIVYNLGMRVIPAKARKIQGEIKKALVDFNRYTDLFERKKSFSIKYATMADNRVSYIADVAAAELLSFGEIIPFAEIIRRRKAVTYEDVRQLVMEEMNPELLYWFIFRP